MIGFKIWAGLGGQPVWRELFRWIYENGGYPLLTRGVAATGGEFFSGLRLPFDRTFAERVDYIRPTHGLKTAPGTNWRLLDHHDMTHKTADATWSFSRSDVRS